MNSQGKIGGTPVAELKRLCAFLGLSARLYAKLEWYSPSGSVKDRTAFAMVEAAERAGKAKGDIVAATSGNLGVAIAALSAKKGRHALLVMPSSMSAERAFLMKAYGAEIVLTEAGAGMAGARLAAERIAKEHGGCLLDQFTDPANPLIHYRTTGPELYRALRPAVLVAGIGSGGTITGAGMFLKERAETFLVGAEPADSPFLSEGRAGSHGIQGIGAGFCPPVLRRELLDEVVSVPQEGAEEMVRLLARTEGIFAGISSGAALWAAAKVAARPRFRRSSVAVILPDAGERYLSVFQRDPHFV